MESFLLKIACVSSKLHNNIQSVYLSIQRDEIGQRIVFMLIYMGRLPLPNPQAGFGIKFSPCLQDWKKSVPALAAEVQRDYRRETWPLEISSKSPYTFELDGHSQQTGGAVFEKQIPTSTWNSGKAAYISYETIKGAGGLPVVWRMLMLISQCLAGQSALAHLIPNGWKGPLTTKFDQLWGALHEAHEKRAKARCA